jgi:hypothetical protein
MFSGSVSRLFSHCDSKLPAYQGKQGTAFDSIRGTSQRRNHLPFRYPSAVRIPTSVSRVQMNHLPQILSFPHARF